MAMNTSFIRFQPVNPASDSSALKMGFSNFQNTTVQSTMSFNLPAITREVQEFVLSGTYFVGLAVPQGSTPTHQGFAQNIAALATAHAVFPKGVGIHGLLQTVTLLTGNGTVLNLENDYAEWVFRNERSSHVDSLPSTNVGVWVEFSEIPSCDKSALTPAQIVRNFLFRIRFRGSSQLNLLGMGGLRLDLTFNTVSNVCTFPQLCFPLGGDNTYANSGYIRPWVFPSVSYSATTAQNLNDFTWGGMRLVSLIPTSLAANPPIQFSTSLSPLNFARALTFYVNATLLAIVSQTLVTSVQEATTYECKACIYSFLPFVNGKFNAVPTPVAGYCIGDARLQPIISDETLGLGWTNKFQLHGYVGYDEWRFNSSLPGYTYAIPENVQTEYAPTMPSNLRDIWLCDRFLSKKPFHTKLNEGVGQYYLGKTFLGATSLTVMITATSANLTYPALSTSTMNVLGNTYYDTQQTEVASLNVTMMRTNVNVAGAQYPSALVLVYTGAPISNPRSQVTQVPGPVEACATLARDASGDYVSDNSRSYNRFTKWNNSVLPYAERWVPPRRTQYDSRNLYRLNDLSPDAVGAAAGVCNNYAMDDQICRSRLLLVPSSGATGTTVNSSTIPINMGCFTPFGSIQSCTVRYAITHIGTNYPVNFKLTPVSRSVPIRLAVSGPPTAASLNWQYTFDTFETRTLSNTTLAIAPSGNASAPIVNPVNFQSYPMSPATNSPLYLRQQPAYAVDPLFAGNFAFQWNAITMGTVAATKIQVPLAVVLDDDTHFDPTSVPEVRIPPLHAYMPAGLTGPNRLMNRPCGDAGCVTVTTYLTPQGSMRNIDERKYMSWNMSNLPLSERLAYENRFRGHGALVLPSLTSKLCIRSNRAYMNMRPSDRYSLVAYNGYTGYSFNSLLYAGPTFSNNANASPLGRLDQKPMSRFKGDRLSFLSARPQFMIMSAEQFPTLRAPLSYPQTPEKQLRIEFDNNDGNVCNVCCGGGVFTTNRMDPHVEMALSAAQTTFADQKLSVPSKRIKPRLAFHSPENIVILQLVYNPADMPQKTALAFAQGIPVRIPTSVSYDTYQALSFNPQPLTPMTNPPAPGQNGHAYLYPPSKASAVFKKGPSIGVEVGCPSAKSAFGLADDTLTIYQQDPLPLGGLNIDNIRIGVRAGYVDSVHRQPTTLPLIQPATALLQSMDDYSMSLFNMNARMDQPLNAQPPPANGVYMRPQVDGMDLRTIEPYFGIPMVSIEQYSLITGGLMLPYPHAALYDTCMPYLAKENVFVPHYNYTLSIRSANELAVFTSATPGVVSILPIQNVDTHISFVRMYTNQSALTGNASLQTLHSMYARHPATCLPLLLFTNQSLGNARLITFNFQFNNQALNTYAPSQLSLYLSTYYTGMNTWGFGLSSVDRNGNPRGYGYNAMLCYMSSVNLFATPQMYTQTIDLFSMDEWIMTMTGVMCVSKAFAR